MKWEWLVAGGVVAAGAFLFRRIKRKRVERRALEPSGVESVDLVIATDSAGGIDVVAIDRKLTVERKRGIDRKIAIPTVMAVASIALWMKMSHGNTLKYTFVPSMAASWVLYMLTYRRRMPDPERVSSLYLLSLAWQMVHFVEENSTGFRYRWPVEIFRTKPYGERQFVAINAISYAIFLGGGVALMKRRPEFSLPAVFFALMGVMYNGVQHPIYSWMVKGYFPGLFTGLVDLVLGPILLRRMFGGGGRKYSGAELPAVA